MSSPTDPGWGKIVQGGSVQGCIHKVCVARCLANPLGRNEDHGAQLGPEGRRASRQAGLLCSALLLAPFFFSSLVLQEQLLHDPTHPYTWLPPSLLPLNHRGFPGEEQEKRGWEGELPESHWSPHLSTWQRQAPASEIRGVVSLGGALRTQDQALENGTGAGLLEI